MSVYGTYGVRCFGFELSFTIVPYGRFSVVQYCVADKEWVVMGEYRTKRAAVKAMRQHADGVAVYLDDGEECECRVLDSSGQKVDEYSTWAKMVKVVCSSR